MGWNIQDRFDQIFVFFAVVGSIIMSWSQMDVRGRGQVSPVFSISVVPGSMVSYGHECVHGAF